MRPSPESARDLSAPSASRVARPPTSISCDAGQLAHPGQLALGVVARARFIASTSPSSSSSKPSAWRAVSDAPAACAARTSSRTPCGDHPLHARVDRRVERLALHRQTRPAGSDGAAHALHSCEGPSGGSSSPRSSSSSARTMRWRSSGSISAAAHGARCGRAARAAPPAPGARAPPSSARARPRAAAGAGRARRARRAGTGPCRRRRSGAARRPAARRSRRGRARRTGRR